jgi:uncharacterized caspase-like protein
MNARVMLKLSAIAAFAVTMIAAADDCLAQDSRSRQWALLIGVERYQKAPQLQFTVNDVRQLAQTFVQYGGYARSHILELTDDGDSEAKQPLKTSLEAALPQFLKKPGPSDSIVVYFSGHGFKDKDGKLYLAPLDCDPANPVATGVSAEWFRGQLEACPASFKLLVLDACHAGAEKGVSSGDTVAAKDLGQLFKSSVGVITLASSTADEKSQIWQYKQQSLFSYWMNQGLKGHADYDGSGSVNVDELYQYVHDHVRQTAEIRFHRAQTPVRIVGPRVPGVPDILHLRPQGLKQIVADMADQIAGTMEEHQLSSLGVLEFTNETPAGEFLGSQFGLLGRYCAEQLEGVLNQRSAGKFNIIDRPRLQAALNKQRFTLTSFGSNDALSNISKDVGGMPVIVKGTLFNRSGRIINLRCKLVATEGVKSLGNVGGLAALSESEWAMLGRSAEIKPEDRRPVVVTTSEGALPMPLEQQVIDNADARAQGAHPMLNPNFPFRVRMFVATNPRERDYRKRTYRERKPVFRGNDCIFPVRKNEVFELRVENGSGKKVLLRLLVDGLNTLPEPETDKGITRYIVGKRVNLDEARHWVLSPDDPKIAGKKPPTWAFRGFVEETGTDGKWKDFIVVDADQSLASRQQFTDQLGLVTAAFYDIRGSTRAPGGGRFGIGQGEQQEGEIRRAPQEEVGNLIAAVNLQYCDEGALAGFTAGRR